MRTLLFFVLLFAGCDGGGVPNLTGHDPLDKVTAVNSDDPAMQAAMEQARATFDEFLASLKDPSWSQSDFSVKVPFYEGDVVEHMWLTSLWIDDGKIVGVVANEPRALTKVRYGDETSVEPSQISDWMYVDDGVLRGAFTLKLLRDQASDEELAEFDRNMPFGSGVILPQTT